MSMSMPTDGDDDGEVICEMNTTPLIDVMLVLLIMLIITIPIQTHAVKLNMPTNNGSSSAPAEPPKVVQINVAADGTVRWDGEPMPDRQNLEYKISEAAKESPQPEIHIRAAGSARYEVVAMVMASAQRLGLTKLGVTGNEEFR